MVKIGKYQELVRPRPLKSKIFQVLEKLSISGFNVFLDIILTFLNHFGSIRCHYGYARWKFGNISKMIKIGQFEPTQTPKIRIFSSWRKVTNKWFSILLRTYLNVLESFWVGLVTPGISWVKIRQYFKMFKIGQSQELT